MKQEARGKEVEKQRNNKASPLYFLLLASVLLASCFSSASAQEKKSILKKTGSAIQNAGKKTGEAVKEVTKTLVEPIQDPKAAVSRWFDYDPRIETGEKKNFNILPLFVSSPERGIGFGLKFAQQSLLNKNDLVYVQAIQTVKNKSSYSLKYEFPPDMMKRFGTEFETKYENYARFYYGIGNQAQKENESEYTPEFFEFKAPLLFGITDHASLGITLSFQNWKIVQVGSAGILQRDLPQLAGANGSRIWTTGLLARWDIRNSKTDPSIGTFLEGNVEYSKKVTDSEADFRRTTLEGRVFSPLFDHTDHVFGIRVFMDYKTGSVPFYLLPELGGIFFNRGLIEGRFRDTLAVCGNWEYRFKIYQRLHWAVFVDGGNVFPEFRAVQFARTKITGGTGMRYYVPPGNLLLARIDGGYGTEGLQIYLTFDHPF